MNIAILGFGIMGTQISALMSLLDFNVTIFTNYSDLELFNRNKKKLSKLFNLPINNKSIIFKNYKELFDINSLVIECVNENLDLKKKNYEIFKNAKYGFFSNSSSFVHNEIGTEANSLHFFNPINLKILETSIDHTGDNLVYNTLLEKLKKINFDFFKINKNRGYLGNSIVFYQISNFFYLQEKLFYKYEDILRMSNKLNLQLNPINLIDLIGVDTCLKILKNLNEKNNQFYIPEILQTALDKNILGKKNKTSIKSLLK
jgi:3-hydroxyacyl-CoA dehydrogenase